MTLPRADYLHFAPKANMPYRPSNGTEGDIFKHYFCDKCKHKDNHELELWCPILTNAALYEPDEVGYPREWHYDSAGYPLCEAYEPDE